MRPDRTIPFPEMRPGRESHRALIYIVISKAGELIDVNQSLNFQVLRIKLRICDVKKVKKHWGRSKSSGRFFSFLNITTVDLIIQGFPGIFLLSKETIEVKPKLLHDNDPYNL